MEKFDIHIHSNCSDGLNSVEEIVEHSRGLGLDGIAITDHNEIAGALKATGLGSRDFRVIPGIEVSSHDGHVLGLGVREMIEREIDAGEAVERIHALGGVAVAVHPYDRIRPGVGDLIYEIDFDAVEVYNGHTISASKGMEMMEGLDIPAVCGSDAHCLEEVGVAVIKTGGDPIEAIRRGEVEMEHNIRKADILKNYFTKVLGM